MKSRRFQPERGSSENAFTWIVELGLFAFWRRSISIQFAHHEDHRFQVAPAYRNSLNIDDNRLCDESARLDLFRSIGRLQMPKRRVEKIVLVVISDARGPQDERI